MYEYANEFIHHYQGNHATPYGLSYIITDRNIAMVMVISNGETFKTKFTYHEFELKTVKVCKYFLQGKQQKCLAMNGKHSWPCHMLINGVKKIKQTLVGK